MRVIKLHATIHTWDFFIKKTKKTLDFPKFNKYDYCYASVGSDFAEIYIPVVCNFFGGGGHNTIINLNIVLTQAW